MLQPNNTQFYRGQIKPDRYAINEIKCIIHLTHFKLVEQLFVDTTFSQDCVLTQPSSNVRISIQQVVWVTTNKAIYQFVVSDLQSQQYF